MKYSILHIQYPQHVWKMKAEKNRKKSQWFSCKFSLLSKLNSYLCVHYLSWTKRFIHFSELFGKWQRILIASTYIINRWKMQEKGRALELLKEKVFSRNVIVRHFFLTVRGSNVSRDLASTLENPQVVTERQWDLLPKLS